jgi:hypothetical protein
MLRVMPRDPLAGYVLYCVSFAKPPVAATATADSSGNFTLTLAAKNVPIGCFIQNTMQKTVASLVFTNGTNRSQTVSFSGDSALGTVTVDTTSGLAQATIGNTGTVMTTTPAGLDCPLGRWSVVIANTSCIDGMPVTQDIFVTKKPDGTYLVSGTTGPIAANAGCGYYTGTIPATYDGTKLVFQSTGSNGCVERLFGSTYTPNQACTSAAFTASQTMCQSCTNLAIDQDCGACGTMTCTADSPQPATRK